VYYGAAPSFGFTGEQTDANGLLYLRARYAQVGTGTFLSKDPFEGFMQRAMSRNGYSYVEGNPVNYTDPSGQFIWGALAVLAGAVAGGIAGYVSSHAIAYNVLYPLIESGACGCEAKQRVQGKRNEFATEVAMHEILPGAVLGGLAATGSIGTAISIAVGVELSAFGILQSVSNIDKSGNIDSACDWLNVFLGTAAVAATVLGVYGAFRGLRNRPIQRLGQAVDNVDNMQARIARILGHCSFSDDTLVTTKEGMIEIEDVEVGDLVLAYDEETRTTGEFAVTALHEHVHEVLVYLVVDGEFIETTPEHPFYTADGEWVAAGDLRVGDRLTSADGAGGLVQSVRVVQQQQTMYNFTVHEAHTYFVGDGQWLVHNDCDPLSSNLPAYRNGYGQSSTLENMNGWSVNRALNYVRSLSNVSRISGPNENGYFHATFTDGSELYLNTVNGDVYRLPVRAYGPDGIGGAVDARNNLPRINRGVRYDPYTNQLYHSNDWHQLTQRETLNVIQPDSG
jgi:RHS repeat-associated protein